MSFYLFRKAIRKLPGIVIKAVPIPEPAITEGYGARSSVGTLCKKKGLKSVLIVTDSTLRSLDFHKKVEQSLRENGIRCTVFSNISSEPSISIVTMGRKAAVDCAAEGIIALGGGSVLDSCKIIAASATHPKRPMKTYLLKFVLAKTLPMISIPSTAGTGAEQTVGAVVKNARGTKKSSVIVGLQVTDVILDSELTENAPARVTWCCGIDALSHGLEGCLADVKVKEEDMYKSRECVRLVLDNLLAVVEDPHNIPRRQALCLAANYGGNAINKQLAGYVHAFAHTLGAYYHIAHGEAIARCLLPVISATRELCTDQLALLAIHCGLADEKCEKMAAADRIMNRLQELLEKAGFTDRFTPMDPAHYPALIKGINADSINYSPRKTLSNKEIFSILEEIRQGKLPRKACSLK